MQAWNVYLLGKWIDTVFYDTDCTADYVRRGLIDHDGYDTRQSAGTGSSDPR